MRALGAWSMRGSALLVLLMAACTPPASGGGTGGKTSSGGSTGTPATGGMGMPGSSGGAPSSSGGASATGGAAGAPTGTGGAAETGGAPGTGGAPTDAGENRDGGAADRMDASGSGGTAPGTGGRGGAGAGTGGAGAGGTTGAGGTSGGRCPAGPFPAPMMVSSQNVCANFGFRYSWNEGPTWVAGENAFFFTNFVAGSASGGDIIKYTPGGSCEIYIRDVGCNGLAVSNDGNLLAACQQSRAIVKFDVKTKQMSIVADRLGTTMLDTPNDLVQHSNGSIYFTNPPNELAGRPQGVGPSVLRIDPMGKVIKINDGNFNGIALSPDERTLYVVRTDVWDLDAQGVPSNRRAMVRNSGDGMAIDCAGNVYVEGKIFGADGNQLGSWGAGTNLAFGGADGKTVLVAGSGKGLRELKMNVPGLP